MDRTSVKYMALSEERKAQNEGHVNKRTLIRLKAADELYLT